MHGTDTPPRRAPAAAHPAARSWAVTVALMALLLSVTVASVLIGPSDISLQGMLGAVIERLGDDVAPQWVREQVILFEIRLPRTVLGCFVGAGLAVSGAMMQGLFRNPLADPTLIGVSAGAALAAVTVIVVISGMNLAIPPAWSVHLLSLAAFGGGLVTTWMLYVIATRSGRTSVATMLLAGIALSALAMALTGVLIFQSTDDQMRDFTFWNMGSLGGATWNRVFAMLPFVAILALAIPFLGGGLNALLLGEAEAFHLGFDPQRLKRGVIVLTAAATGACVASAGTIGFVGIVVPHVLRLVIGADHRRLLPACALLGAALMVGADIISRVIVAPAELPIGIITAILGVPVFLSILLRRRSIIDI
ncbi:iron ABC transporter permease [Breoghania sp. L-A4]|uniref:FecCD family ABC transporter permease n=1 Tax=Breoghania sp. L-A4 TaxID=2304600 RepID=UPI0020C0B37C|nr:iron ABC transporter permease [Breoghania sp. L-A4]